MTVRCPSNSRSASSTSGLRSPATQSSAGRVGCSCLPWPAVLTRRPHRPHTTPTAGQAISLLTHTPVILRRQQPHTAAEPVNPRTPLCVGIHSCIFPGSESSPSKASPSSTAVVLLARHGQRGQGTTSIGRGLYVERLTVGSTATAQFFYDLPSKSLCQACWAANLSRRGELHSAGRENGLSVMINGMYIFKTHQTGN